MHDGTIAIGRWCQPQSQTTVDLPALPAGGGVDSLLDLASLQEFQRQSEIAFLRHHLERNGWHVAATARIIGTPRSNLYKKMRAYGIEREQP